MLGISEAPDSCLLWLRIGDRSFRRSSFLAVCNNQLKLFLCISVHGVDVVRYRRFDRVCAGEVGCVKGDIHDGVQDNHTRRSLVRADCSRELRCFILDCSVRRNQTHVCSQLHPLGCRPWVVRYDKRKVKRPVQHQLPDASRVRPIRRRHKYHFSMLA
jgi:hypothetical protein